MYFIPGQTDRQAGRCCHVCFMFILCVCMFICVCVHVCVVCHDACFSEAFSGSESAVLGVDIRDVLV